MHIDHVALWTSNLERMKEFYRDYFGARAGEKYVNESKGFSSYFLDFEDGARLELMHSASENQGEYARRGSPVGYAHLALSTGSKEAVDALTNRLDKDGFEVVDGPRMTGDGYYESTFLDPEGNRIELTV